MNLLVKYLLDTYSLPICFPYLKSYCLRPSGVRACHFTHYNLIILGSLHTFVNVSVCHCVWYEKWVSCVTAFKNYCLVIVTEVVIINLLLWTWIFWLVFYGIELTEQDLGTDLQSVLLAVLKHFTFPNKVFSWFVKLSRQCWDAACAVHACISRDH